MSMLLKLWNLVDTRSATVGLVVFFVLYWLLHRPRNLPPGPTGWPVLGYLPQLAMAMMAGEEPHTLFCKLAAKYGNVVSVNVAGNLVVVLHGHDTIKSAFNQHQLSARPTFHVSEHISEGVGVIASSGDVWTELRRFSLTVLRGLGVGKSSFEENIATEARFLAEEWEKHKGASFDPKDTIAPAVSNVICSVVFGKRFQYTDDMLVRFLRYSDDIMDEVGAGGAIEFSSFLSSLKFLPRIKRYIATARRFNNQVRLMIEDHDRDRNSEELRDFIDAFLKHKENLDKQGSVSESDAFNTSNMGKTVGDLFVAGSETTATTLRWSMLYMMAYPEVQRRVQNELDDVTRRNRLPRISDKPDLPYTEAVICEIQRTSTIVPLAVPHASSEDTTLLGYNIPKGSVVLSNLWHNHFDPAVWEEPEVFRPERFLDANGKVKICEELTPFGIGRRICLGEHLARMEVFIFFTLLVHHFTFKKPEDVATVSLRGINGGTWAPAPFKVCAVPRD